MTPIYLEFGTPVLLDRSRVLSGAAFDGCHYYFTCPSERVVIQTNCALSIECRIETARGYECLCYDSSEHCFWASARDCCSRLYKLNCELREIDSLSFRCPDMGSVTGLSFCCACDRLLIALGSVLVRADTHTGECQPLYMVRNQKITGVLCLSPGSLFTTIGSKHRNLTILDANGCVKNNIPIVSDRQVIRSMFYHPSSGSCREATFDFFAIKNSRYPFLYRIPVSFLPLGFCPSGCNDWLTCCAPEARPWRDNSAHVLETLARNLDQMLRTAP